MSKEGKSRVQEFGYRAPRFPVEFRVLLETSDTGPQVLVGLCTDISADGLAVRMAECLSVGTQVLFMFTLPGSATSLRVAGRVTYQKDGEHGFAFMFSSDEERDLIQKQLSSLGRRTVPLRRPPR
ncbi:MAG TPA: PilZ domain-containing protein [Terriglobales bacterium]|nr:PilZ domain-containing protein [Terriglobales bacterium]